MNAALQARIDAALAKPCTHRVTTHYDTGTTRHHDTRCAKSAENWATGERRKMDRYLIDRESGGYVCIVAVTIAAIPKTEVGS
jgi:hypothetical protein